MKLAAVLYLMAAPLIGASVLDERIIGGEKTTIDKYPATVSLRKKNGHHGCGGSLIENYTVVSAAHCFDHRFDDSDDSDLDRAVYGSNYLSKGGTTHKFSAIEKHPHYNRKNFWANDVAVIKLNAPVTLLEGASFAKLRSTPIIVNETCSVIGWGREVRSSDGIASLPDQLKRAEVLARSENFCTNIFRKWFNRGINPGNICAAPRNYEHNLDYKGDASCKGDSGGPLHCEDGFTGIVSYGPGTCGKIIPDVYAEISFYKSWIEETIEQLRNIH